MASYTSIQKSFKYDVFLSFRGEDTRKTFVDHLYLALHRRGITTYKDDEKIEKGKRISDQLIRSIEDSRFYIIVFSKNYASSSWCLDELVKIMECHKTTEQTAYPVFFNVEPTEVRNQSGEFGEAFAKHEKEETSGKWRDSLIEASNLAGRELKTTFDGHEAKFIQQIVLDISLELRFINSSVDGKLIGMETRVNDVVSYLKTGTNDVHIIGIKGIGGGGKTTLARAVFDHISSSFEGKSFVENVREVSKGSSSLLKKLQKQVLKDVLNDRNIDVTSVNEGNIMMKKIMGSRKVLVVLDDVDDIEQLEALAGEPTWFKPGSTIIITTRNEQVLLAYRVKFIHDVNLLSHEEGIRLFSKYAFGKDIPIVGYEELSKKVVYYANGLPLTIKVLGSSLCGKTECEWDDAIERLKTIPEEQTLRRLELSYTGLEHDHKEIFLELACILKGKSKDEAIRILECCGFHARFALKVLEQRSLITISDYGCLNLHDRIEEMGRNIVRRLHPREPQRHNRLWIKEEIENILVNELGTKATLSIKLKNTDLHPAIIMKGLRKMKKLRVLYIHNEYIYTEQEVDEAVRKYLPNALQSLHWERYPFRCLPDAFQANKLINLEMRFSNISQLWEGGERKVLNELRFVNLNSSKLRTFDLGLTQHLESLDLGGCNDLVELHMPVECPKLKFISLNGSKVSHFNLGRTPQLESLDLGGCNDLVELHMPIECPKLESISLGGSKVSHLNLGRTPQLKSLYLGGCNDLVELHMPVECPKLEFISLSGSKVSHFNLGRTPQLKSLDLGGCNDLVELHMPVECPKLKFISLSGSKVSHLNLGRTPQLESLYLRGCNDLVELHMPVECPKLESISLSGSKVSHLNLRMTPHLNELNLEGCNDLVELHMPVECPKLESISLSGSKVSHLNLRMTPHLNELNLEGCNDLVELHMPVECPKLESISLSGSKVSHLNLRMTPHLNELNLEGCNDLVELHMPVECPKLESISLSGSKVSHLNLGRTPQLESLYLGGCNDLVELHMPVECPKLESISLSGSKVSHFNLGQTPQLESLDLGGCNDLVELHMPVECPKLEFFSLSGSKVSHLNLGRTPQLESLYLRGCNDLVELHMPVECSKLEFILLSCSKVSHLNLRMTPQLNELNLEGCNDLVELHMPVECPKLKFISLSGSKVSHLNLGRTPQLESLDLGGCNDLVELHMPVECPKLEFISLSGSKVSHFNLGWTPQLESLDLGGCNDLVELHMPVECPKLKVISLSGSKVSHLNLGRTPQLESLYLRGCNDLVELHMPVECPKLEFISLSGSKVSHLNLRMTPHLKELNLEGCNDLVELHMPVECPKLKFISLSGSKVSHLNLGRTPQLESLYLRGCNDLVELHMPVECPKLEFISLSGSKVSHLNLRMTPHLKELNLEGCSYLQEIHAPVGSLKSLVCLNLSGCLRFEYFLVEKRFACDSLAKLELTAESLHTCPLHPNNNLPKFQFKCKYKEPKSWSGNVEKLISFGLCACTNLESFSATVCGLQNLRKLTLEGSIPEVPKDLCKLETLEELSLSMKVIRHLPDSICMLKHLKSLNLKSCWILERLPKELGRLEYLEKLILTECIQLRDIPDSICNMKRLIFLHLSYCIRVEKLPEEFGSLERLIEFDIEGAGIIRLPQSIFQLKGLCIVGSRWRLESYGFTSIHTAIFKSRHAARCYL